MQPSSTERLGWERIRLLPSCRRQATALRPKSRRSFVPWRMSTGLPFRSEHWLLAAKVMTPQERPPAARVSSSADSLRRHQETHMTTQAKVTTKAGMVTRILLRDKGATVLEMSKATGWQPHSCRAFLTGLRKKFTVVKEQRGDGKLAYRLQPTVGEVAE